MRRLHGGWLAAPLLLLATGCGTSGADAAPPTSLTPPPALVAERAVEGEVASVAPSGEGLRVLVVAVDGANAPGLDAAVTALLGRPELNVVAVAPGVDATRDHRTMSGFPVRGLSGGIEHILDGNDGLDERPDLVVIGITSASVVGASVRSSAAASVAELAQSRGVPSMVVGGDGGDVDYAAAALQLSELFDFELDQILEGDAPWVLAVPRCAGGTVRERLRLPLGDTGVNGPVDCLDDQPLAPGDASEAHARGHATLSQF